MDIVTPLMCFAGPFFFYSTRECYLLPLPVLLLALMPPSLPKSSTPRIGNGFGHDFVFASGCLSDTGGRPTSLPLPLPPATSLPLTYVGSSGLEMLVTALSGFNIHKSSAGRK